jgi:hypothetical protein
MKTPASGQGRQAGKTRLVDNIRQAREERVFITGHTERNYLNEQDHSRLYHYFGCRQRHADGR